MIEDLKTNTNLVEKILREDLRSRDDDTYLMFKVWEHQGFKVPQELVENIIALCFSQESIRRTRQKIQESGKYRGKTYAQRHQEADSVRNYFRGQKDFFNSDVNNDL